MKKIAFILFIAVLFTSGKPIKKNDYLAANSDPVNSVVGYTVSSYPAPAALFTDKKGGRQYVAFYDADRVLNVAQRYLPDGAWKYVKLDEVNPLNSTAAFAMTMDTRGVLHLSGNMRVQKLVYFCTDAAGDISTLHRVSPLIGPDEELTSFPRFNLYPKGELLYRYRLEGKGKGYDIYNILDAKGNWSRRISSPVADGQGKMTAYVNSPTHHSDGYYHFIWVWRDTPDASTTHDLCYARTKDLILWETVDGKPVSLPMTYDDKATVVDPVPVEGGLLNGGVTIGWDSKKRLLLGYFKYDENGYTNLYIARRDGSEWDIRKVTDWKFTWDLKGQGAANRQVWVNKLRNDEDGDIAFTYTRFDPTTQKKWTKVLYLDLESLTTVCENPVKNEKPYPDYLDKKQNADMQVNVVKDNAGGRTWFLRWESMPLNSANTASSTESAELRVIQVD